MNEINKTELGEDQPVKLRLPKMAAEKTLPKSGAPQLVKIIKAYAIASNGGENPVNYKDVASAAGVAPNSVSGNNGFLEESLILTSPKYGYYVPTEGAVRFAREAAWDETRAKAHLRRIISGSWFGQVVIQTLTLRPSLSRDELRKSLAIKCGATEGDTGSLGFLIDFILYTELAISEDDITINRGNFDEVPRKPENIEHAAGAAADARSSQEKIDRGVQGSSKRISLVCHIHVRDFSELTNENAAALRKWINSLESSSVEFEISPDANTGETAPGT